MEAHLRSTILPQLAHGWRPYAILTLLCLLLYLPGLAEIPPLDRDESRFAQATVQMLETGDPLRIRFQDTERNKKPGGAYWLQALSVSALSSVEAKEMWAHRLPSTLAAIAAVLLSFFMGSRLVGREAAFIGASLLGGTIMLSLEAHQAKTDAFLLLTIVVAQAGLSRIYLHAHEKGLTPPLERSWLLFWVALGLGGLIKGPITALIALFSIVVLTVWDRDWTWLKPMRAGWGLLLAVGLVLPWAVGIGIVTEGRFFIEAIGHDMLGKVSSGQESHGAPPGYYLGLFPLMAWPMALMIVPAVVAAWKFRHEAAAKFLIAWAIPIWVMFEFVPTKLPHYVLPAYPALALLAGWALIRIPEILSSWPSRAVAGLSSFLALGLALAGMVLPFVYGSTAMPLAVLAALVAVGLIFFTFVKIWQGRALSAWMGAILAVAVLLPTTFQGVIPRLTAFDVSGRMAEAINRQGGGVLAITGYHEPSLVFRLGTETLLVSAAEAAEALSTKQAAFAAVEEREATAFIERLSELGNPVETVGYVTGFNYSKGKAVALTIYRLVP